MNYLNVLSLPAKSTRARSTMRKHSIVIDGHKTSIKIEDEFWAGLNEIVAGRCIDATLSAVVDEIDLNRPRNTSLAAAIRVAVLAHTRMQLDVARALAGLSFEPSAGTESGG